MVFVDPAVSDTLMPEDSTDKLFEAWWLNMAWNHNRERYTCYDLAFQLFGLGFFLLLWVGSTVYAHQK